jgi:FkbM family methyltransferase
MYAIIKKIARKTLESWGINPTYILQFKYTDAYKWQTKLISSPDVIFDVGAYDGRTVLKYRKIYQKAKIISFEPSKKSYIKLRENLKKDKNVILENIALTNFSGESELFINKSQLTNSLLPANPELTGVNSSCTFKKKESINCETIDRYCSNNSIDKIDILKIDVQGAELSVLEGATGMLENKKIKLIYAEVEFAKIYLNQPLFHNIAWFLEKKGYDLFSLYNLAYDKKSGRLIYGDAIFISNPQK